MKPADDATRFLEISPYLDRPTDIRASLAGDVRADVAIIGGGYTGLSTALALHEAGVSAVVLERHFCGFGASGRNAGHLTPTICKDLPTAKMLFGRDAAAALVRFADHCVERTEQLMREYGIACDYQPTGNIMTVVHRSQERRLRLATEAAGALGARTRFVEAGEMRERGLPTAFLCGALEEAGGTLHPGRLVQGLRSAALERGIRIFEQTTVTGVEAGTPVRIVSADGSVSADRVLMATNAYAPEVGKPGQRLCPLYITLFETAPLSDAQLESIGGWKGREGIYTAHESMETFRLTAERTIIGGSKDVQYFYDCRPHDHGGDGDARKASVIRAFRERFPGLADLPIAHAWAGWCGFTLNFLPVVGRDPDDETFYYSVGYNGHGVAQATAMGGLLADLMTGRRNRWHEVICRKPAYMPPKPLRYLSIKALLGIVNGVDRRIDRKIRAGRSATRPA
jgi:glycine/D-amino acid oxidase-like deaminating enzyme